MGSYLNPGNFSFRGSLRSKIYVDKSKLLAKTNEALCTEQKYICVSRPRRFGKSMAANMLAAYYDRNENTEDLFQNLVISEDKSYHQQRKILQRKSESVRCYQSQYTGISEYVRNDRRNAEHA